MADLEKELEQVQKKIEAKLTELKVLRQYERSLQIASRMKKKIDTKSGQVPEGIPGDKVAGTAGSGS
ncbi:MAG TPA: hypothetical protein DCX95_03040 [Elusimicrobia bacterium]|nr:hypothetical protein [Elusimicrobiota bacterium]